MEIEKNKPIRIEQGKMNRRGQVIIPKGIRKVFKILETQENMSIEIQLLPSGKIQLVPMFPMSVFMDTDDELLQSAVRAYADKERRSYASEPEIKEMLGK
jgi:bifunctional DNA-binding transcriptional regulator/antitoxin component of YhaV-PrlF toxin-antitoxin module